MKTLKKLICFLVLTVIAANLFGCNDFKAKEYVATENEYFNFTLNESGDGYVVSAKDVNDLPEKLNLPEEYEGKPVVAVAEQAFAGANITALKIPSNIKTVGVRAFSLCLSLTEVYMYKGLTELGGGAFYGCVAVSSLTLPKSLKVIGSNAFYDCSSIKTLELPESLNKIGDYAFAFCVLIKHVYIPHAVSEIGENTFAGCSDEISFTVSASNPYIRLDENGYPKKIAD